MKHTIKSLLPLNDLYDYEHKLNEKDVDVANIYTKLIEKTRFSWKPAAGDVLIGTDGDYYHIDEIESETVISTEPDKKPERVHKMGLCELRGAYVSFIRATLGDSNAKISLSTSGGPWSSKTVAADKLRLLHSKERNFKFFGHCGARGNGAVHFPAIVNVWQEEVKE